MYGVRTGEWGDGAAVSCAGRGRKSGLPELLPGDEVRIELLWMHVVARLGESSVQIGGEGRKLSF